MTAKYGAALTGEGWNGWPLRVGHFPQRGKLESLCAAQDTILLWSGGKSDVTLHVPRGRQTERINFVRHEGMIDVLPRGTVLEEVHWSGQSNECVSVCFDSPSVERLLGRPMALDRDSLRTALADPHAVDLVRRLREQAVSNQPWGPLYVEGLSLTLASYVYGRYAHAPEPHEAPALTVEEVQRVGAFVEERLSDSLSLVRLAAVVGYSPDHFARLFKRAFGSSPYQYVLQRRVERAKALLRKRSSSIAEVALACGFASQSHLHAAFKARTGVTPGVYRRA